MAFDVTDKRVTVAGAARSGLAAAELLARRGARVTLSEMRAEAPEPSALRPLGVALELGGHQTETFTAPTWSCSARACRRRQPAVQAARDRGVPVIAEIELASRWLEGRVIAITGTKGKSTTTALTGRMLEAAGFKVTVGGNIGAPLSAQVSDSTPDTLHVVETSSFQLEQIDTFHPWIAVMLNFSPDHLDRHPTVGGAMPRRRRGSSRTRTRAISRSSTPTTRRSSSWRGAAARRRARSRAAARFAAARWSRTAGSSTAAQDRGAARAARRDPPARPAPGERRHGGGDRRRDRRRAPPEAMTAAVDAFRGLEHAMEPAGEVDGVRFVNDSKATNVESALRSIESFERDLVPIIGGRVQGRRSPAAARAAARARQGRRRDRRRPAARPRSARGSDRGAGGGQPRGRGRSGVSRWRSRQVWCCSRRRARASTCFAITRSAGAASRTRCGGLHASMAKGSRGVCSHQHEALSTVR